MTPEHPFKKAIYKEGQYLTDGNSVIRIGSPEDSTWTTENNYGRKHPQYCFCTGVYCDETEQSHIFTQMGNRGKIWEPHLTDSPFRLIDKWLISLGILKTLDDLKGEKIAYKEL